MKYTHSFFSKLLFSLGLVFSGSYFLFSALLSPTITFQILANNTGQHQFLSEIFAPSANAAHSYIRTELSWDGTGNANGFWCSTGVPVQFQNDTGNRDRAIWKECFATPAGAAGYYPATPLGGNVWSGATIGGYGAGAFSCQSGSTLRGYNIRISSTNDYNTEWYACSSNTVVPITPITPPPPTFSPQPSCAGTSISANFSSAGASWYAVRLADLTSGNLISNGICDPASNSNETCQWQTGTSLNRTGIAGHRYRMWVHGATNTSWSAGTYSAATYATDFSCPVAVVTPPPPTISPQPSCVGTSISANFSSAGASWYAVRLADLTSGNLIANGICDPASNSNETCQWQTGTSLNRTGIAGHSYRFWVHGATNTSWSSGTYSGAAYATDFSCPAVSSAVNGSCGSANGGTTSTAPTSNLCSAGSATAVSLSGSTYSWRCLGSGGGSTANCSSNYSSGVVTVPAPTVNLTASPTSLAAGGGTTYLTWSTTNASSCTASNGWSGSKPTSGNNVPMTISGTTTFTLQCWNSDFSASDTKSATVTVASVSSGPSADIKANGLDGTIWISRGQSANITWSSSGVSSCSTYISTATPTTYSALSNSIGISTGPLTSDRNFDITCFPSANDYVSVKIGTPPASVNGTCGSANGGTTSTPPTSGLCSTGSTTAVSLSGSTYSWQCLGSNGGSNANCSSYYSASASTTVTVNNVCAPDCTNAPNICQSVTFDDANGCGTNNCTGTRSCDYNWKEVAP